MGERIEGEQFELWQIATSEAEKYVSTLKMLLGPNLSTGEIAAKLIEMIKPPSSPYPALKLPPNGPIPLELLWRLFPLPIKRHGYSLNVQNATLERPDSSLVRINSEKTTILATVLMVYHQELVPRSSLFEILGHCRAEDSVLSHQIKNVRVVLGDQKIGNSHVLLKTIEEKGYLLDLSQVPSLPTFRGLIETPDKLSSTV